MEREDLLMLGRLEEAVATLKLGQDDLKKGQERIETIVSDQRTCCTDLMKAHGERLDVIEADKRAVATVVTWKDQFFSKSTALLLIIITGAGFVLDHLPDLFNWLRNAFGGG